ncbi:MAG: response regulator [Desulfobacteraceae bacterium]|nr:response regulator [Desulfobacteraceae bacterium]
MVKILIVDDEEMGRTVMEEMFCKYGEFISVSTGKDAVRVYEEELEQYRRFDLVFLDISLEDISGLEVLKQIKAIEESKGEAGKTNTVVIMVTAHSEKEIVIDCIRAGCKGYFIKPLKQESVDKKLLELGFKTLQSRNEN